MAVFGEESRQCFRVHLDNLLNVIEVLLLQQASLCRKLLAKIRLSISPSAHANKTILLLVSVLVLLLFSFLFIGGVLLRFSFSHYRYILL